MHLTLDIRSCCPNLKKATRWHLPRAVMAGKTRKCYKQHHISHSQVAISRLSHLRIWFIAVLRGAIAEQRIYVLSWDFRSPCTDTDLAPKGMTWQCAHSPVAVTPTDIYTEYRELEGHV